MWDAHAALASETALEWREWLVVGLAALGGFFTGRILRLIGVGSLADRSAALLFGAVTCDELRREGGGTPSGHSGMPGVADGVGVPGSSGSSGSPGVGVSISPGGTRSSFFSKVQYVIKWSALRRWHALPWGCAVGSGVLAACVPLYGSEALLLPLGWVLLCVSAADLRYRLVPDMLSVPLAAAGIVVSISGGPVLVEDAVLGLVAGYMVPCVFSAMFRMATGREGMGQGDCKLLAAIGAWGGWQILPATAFGAALGACLLVICRVSGRMMARGAARSVGRERLHQWSGISGNAARLRTRLWNDDFPFAPYLAVAGFYLLALQYWGG